MDFIVEPKTIDEEMKLLAVEENDANASDLKDKCC